MKRQLLKTEIVAIAAILFGIGMLIDIITQKFEPVALVFSIVLIVVGRHYRSKEKRKRGTILLSIGALIFIIHVFSSAAFQLLLASGIIYTGYELLQSRRRPMMLEIKTKEATNSSSAVLRSEPFLKNMFVGNYRVMDCVYELQDINIRYGVGDVQIDLTTAMIAEGETVIVIHGLVGNIRLYVPYDIELSLNHSMLLGRVSAYGHEEKGWNRNFILQSEQYREASRRVKIISSLLVGDTEVRYI